MSAWVLEELWASWSSLWLHQKHLPILQLGSQKHLSWHSQWSLSHHLHKMEGSHIAKRTEYSLPTTCRMLLSSCESEPQGKCNMGFHSPFSWEYPQVLNIDNFRLTSWVEDFRKAKINNFYVRFFCFVLKKEVFRLKISMANSRIMAIVDRLENLLENSSGFPLRKVLFF